MSARAEALRTVAESISEYADTIYIDSYGDQRNNEREQSIKDHFEGLAGYLQDKATEIDQ